jgi:hypothetical protein
MRDTEEMNHLLFLIYFYKTNGSNRILPVIRPMGFQSLGANESLKIFEPC